MTRVIVAPSQANIQTGKKQTFTAKGIDQFGRDFEIGKFEWTATGGDIGEDGVFKASNDEGSFFVTAKSGKIAGEAAIFVIKEGKGPQPPHPPDKLEKLLWTGEIPAQKWMNFYTKVLTRFVKGENLNITVSFNTTSKDGISGQQIEETKAALRELGLDDNLKTGKL